MQKLAKLTRLIPIIVITILLWAPLYPVLAEDSSKSATSRGPQRPIERINLLEQRRAEITQKIEQFREKIASREALLKERLTKFKDQTLANIAGRVSENLNKVNKNRTDEMTKHLDTLSNILGKVSLRASGSATPSASVGDQIASASAAIGAAQSVVNTQAQKDYTISATSEANLRGEVKSQRDLLFKDLTNARKAILDAKQAVVNAIKATAGSKGAN